MILKTRSHDGGWRWRDQVRSVNSGGLVEHPEHPGAALTFQTWHELRAWVDKTYGVEREFVEEWWPTYLGEDPQRSESDVHVPGVYGAYTIRPIVGRLADGSALLVLAGQETYLLNDQGDTIERL